MRFVLRLRVLDSAIVAALCVASAGARAQSCTYGPGAALPAVLVNSGASATLCATSSISVTATNAVTVTNGALTSGDGVGTVTLTATNTVPTQGLFGLRVQGTNASASAINNIISASGANSDAVSAADGGQITLTGGQANYTKTTSTSDQQSALAADGTGSLLTANNVTVNTTNANTVATPNTFSFGAGSKNGGRVVMNGGTITANSSTSLSAPRSYGVNAAQGSVDINNVTVVTNGTYSHGVVGAGGTANVSGGR